MDAGIAAKPGLLPLGVTACFAPDIFKRRLQGDFPAEIRRKLFMPNGLRRRFGRGSQHAARLFHKTVRRHFVHPAVNARIKPAAVAVIDADITRQIRRRLRSGTRIQSRFCFAAGVIHFQCTDHTPHVIRMDLFRRLRVDAAQGLIKRFLILPGQTGTQLCIGLYGRKDDIFQKAVDKKPGAAGQNRHMAARRDLRRFFSGQPGEISGAERSRLRQKADQMIRHTHTLLRRRRSRCDRHATVDLHGIGADHLTAEHTGKLHGKRRFAAGRGSDHRNNFHAAHWIRPNCFSSS